jgi:hypothetical protein
MPDSGHSGDLTGLAPCLPAEAVKHDMDQKAPPDEGKDEGVFHCVAGKSFASKTHSSWQPYTPLALSAALIAFTLYDYTQHLAAHSGFSPC